MAAPLADAGLSKADIRELSRLAGLPTWDRPASACLSSRIPYGTPVTIETVKTVEAGEEQIKALGFRQFRVRFHGDVVRVEIAPEEMANGQLPVAEYDWVVDATGSPDGLRQAVAMARPRGTVILKSTVHGTVGVDTAPIIVNEVTLVGSRCGRFEAAIPLLDHALIRTDEMIAARFPLRDAAEAFERAAQPGVLKVLLEAR